MTTANRENTHWSQLGALSAQEREERMLERYEDLARLSEDDRVSQIQELLDVEFALPDEKLLEVTKSRLQVFLKMDEDNAKSVGQGYESVMKSASGNVAMKRVGMAQSAAIQLSKEVVKEDIERLRGIVPGALGTGSRIAPSYRDAEPEVSQSKPWWAFWRSA